MTKSEIGTLVAVEVMEGVTKCQVAAGEEAIKEKFNSGEKLIVIVDKQGNGRRRIPQRSGRCVSASKKYPVPYSLRDADGVPGALSVQT